MLRRIFCFCIALSIISNAVGYSGGDGIKVPYEIANLDDFLQLTNTPEDWDNNFILTADIDLIGNVFTAAPIAPNGELNEPKFTGVFDGNGHTISNLTINEPTKDYVGLFGYVGSGYEDSCMIKNLGVINVNIQGRDLVGGLAGWNNSTISGCYATGNVSGDSEVGGLVGGNGRLGPTISDSYSTCEVSGNSKVGGLVGTNFHIISSSWATGAVSGVNNAGGLVGDNYLPNGLGMITQCYATGSVEGDNTIGGLIGYNFGTVVSCHATGQVSATGIVAGGLIGSNRIISTVKKCFASGPVSGQGGVGGLVGDSAGAISSCCATGTVTGTGSCFYGGLVASNSGPITNCYAIGSVTGAMSTGGLVGWNYYGVITNSYAAGKVIGTELTGGLIGDNGGTVSAAFWDTVTSGFNKGTGNPAPDPDGLLGKATVQMKTLSTFTDAGWDFSFEDGDIADWVLKTGEYPILSWQLDSPPPVAGDISVIATNANPILVELTATDDGLPGPLSFIITALPAHGRLIDPNFGEIFAVPYVLETQRVVYQACPYALEGEQFSYKANDSGTAPNGGDSNEALVAITFNFDVSIHPEGNWPLLYPFYTTFEDCRLQAIYTPQEFGAAKRITSIELNVYDQPAAMSNFTVRMQHTSMGQYPDEPNFINNGWTTVFQGTYTIVGTGWRRINFQSPFDYDGLSHVLLDISYNNAYKAYDSGQLFAFVSPGRVICQKARNNGDPLFWRADTVGCLTVDTVPDLKVYGLAGSTPIISDFNVDCRVGLDDLIEFTGAWMSQDGDGTYGAKYDISFTVDNKINLEDLSVISSEWLTGPFDGPFYLSGDFDLSGTIDVLDLAFFVNAWLSQSQEPNYDDSCDISVIKDKKIDINDWNVFAAQWMET